jgi:hypothetical protein
VFVGTLAAGLLAEPLAAEAQQPTKIARIGYLALNPAANPQLHGAFRQGLRDLGYVRRLTAARVGGFVPKLCLTRAHSGSLQRTPTHVAVGSFHLPLRERRLQWSFISRGCWIATRLYLEGSAWWYAGYPGSHVLDPTSLGGAHRPGDR